ncbi:class II aldolase/adducin family protein [Henriciella sp.]|uniref:class II aldolase/adducin family protein n=1 Tax=Henriciella sp. TaxID=1968823 RepID=UPI00260DD414|nr:class II aldolase/adducin family protein [Henriciella sp.]
MPDDMKALDVKNAVSAEEWQARVDCAMLYRLVALHGWDDMIFTHISHRVPGPEHHFLINPYGMFFEEITASSLVKVDLDGNIVMDTPHFINPAGFTIHSAIHANRDDANVVIHVHTDQGVAVSAQKEGLLPITQTAMIVREDLAYHDYEGIALDLDERERLVADLGPEKSSMMLRNHGTLTCGPTAAMAFTKMFFLERACKMQVLALSGGRENVLEAGRDIQEKVAGQGSGGMETLTEKLIWPGLKRKLDRNMPGYDS